MELKILSLGLFELAGRETFNLHWAGSFTAKCEVSLGLPLGRVCWETFLDPIKTKEWLRGILLLLKPLWLMIAVRSRFAWFKG